LESELLKSIQLESRQHAREGIVFQVQQVKLLEEIHSIGNSSTEVVEPKAEMSETGPEA
jgi:hypothetical protein